MVSFWDKDKLPDTDCEKAVETKKIIITIERIKTITEKIILLIFLKLKRKS